MEKGEKTRARIIEAAKHEFYNKGYNAVTMTELTKLLGYQPSWISYYFKRKENLVAEIMLELDSLLYDCIMIRFPHLEDPLVIRFIIAREVYLLIMNDKKYCRYRYELAQKNITMSTNNDFMAVRYSDIEFYYKLKNKKISYSPLFDDIHPLLNNSAILKLFSDPGKININNVIETTSAVERVVPLMMGIPFDEVKQADADSIQYLGQIDLDDFNILKKASFS